MVIFIYLSQTRAANDAVIQHFYPGAIWLSDRNAPINPFTQNEYPEINKHTPTTPAMHNYEIQKHHIDIIGVLFM